MDLLPITTGILSPPAKAIYARLPPYMPMKLNVWPAFTRTARYLSTGFPSIFAPRSPPVTAMISSSVNFIVGPIIVISMTASFVSFPTRILASDAALVSMTPDTDIPVS